MTAEANVMRMASRTMSEARMKTWLAASAAPRPTTAMPPQAMPLASSSQMNVRAPLVDVAPRCAAGQELAAGRDHEELHGDDGRQPRGGLQHGRPEHRGQREDDGQQREGDARGQLVAHEHRQQLVLELRLQVGALREARAQLAHLRLHRAPAGPWRAVGGSGLRWLSPLLHRLPRRAARPMRTRTARSARARRFEACRQSRGKSLNSRLSAQSGSIGLLPPRSSLPPMRRSTARSLHGQLALRYHCLNESASLGAPTMKILQTKTAPNPRRVRIFLAEKGIEVPYEELDLMKGALKTPEFTKLNRVPARAGADPRRRHRRSPRPWPSAAISRRPSRSRRCSARAPAAGHGRDVEPAHGARAAVQRGPGVPPPASGHGAARGAAGGRLGRGQQAAGRWRSCSSWTRSWASGALSPGTTTRSPTSRRWWPSISRGWRGSSGPRASRISPLARGGVGPAERQGLMPMPIGLACYLGNRQAGPAALTP